jgi:hypothetical protein
MAARAREEKSENGERIGRGIGKIKSWLSVGVDAGRVLLCGEEREKRGRRNRTEVFMGAGFEVMSPFRVV